MQWEVYKVASTQKTVTKGTPSLRTMRGDYVVFLALAEGNC